MKTKIILFLGVVALITLSFTFTNTPSAQKIDARATTSSPSANEIQGFVSDDVVK